MLDLTMTTLAEMDLVIGYEVNVGDAISLIFMDGFEDGDVGQWSSSLP